MLVTHSEGPFGSTRGRAGGPLCSHRSGSSSLYDITAKGSALKTYVAADVRKGRDIKMFHNRHFTKLIIKQINV